jgi:pyruvate dehydrogenase E1 component alpha subunit
VAFFGEGSTNQGMMLEAFNFATALNLPVLFVCKDNSWAITTQSPEMTGGTLVDRAHGFGMDAVEVDGTDPAAVWNVVHVAMEKIRSAGGPYFIQAKCEHKEGHFLGDPLLRFIKTPKEAFGQVTGPLMRSMFAFKGSAFMKRMGSVGKIFKLIFKSRKQISDKHDPAVLRGDLVGDEKARLDALNAKIGEDINGIVNRALQIMGEGS